ncbi:MAG: nitroreductase family protein [Clostridiaceae bacterium]
MREPMKMSETIKTLITRRSIRAYKEEQIKEEELAFILEAGKFAPSGMGLQSAIMIVVQDKGTIEKLSRLNAAVMGREGEDPFYGAPTVIAVLGDKEIKTYLEDGSLVMGNLMNAAASIGVSSCWIHRAKEVFETDEGRELLKSLGISENYVGIGNCILGYGEGEAPMPKKRKDNYVYRIK